MGFFSNFKNKLSNSSLPEPSPTLPKLKVCNHKYQDFPWYLEADVHTGYYQEENVLIYKLIEPYVCIYCGERKNVVLQEQKFTGYSKSNMTKILNQVHEQYSDRIKPKPIIEDMINDMKLVDSQYLLYYHMLHGTKNPSTSQQDKKDFDLKI